VTSCIANGVPLGAALNEKFFKAIFIDVGLCSVSLGLSLSQITSAKDILFVNKGGLAEQVVGQLLRTINYPYIQPELYYWVRNEKGSCSEVDYVIQVGPRIVPVEVKGGSTGTLRSLHLFMGLKKLSDAVRVNSDLPSKMQIQIKDSFGKEVHYHLFSIPFYLVGQIMRLLEQSNLTGSSK
jgi:hypothetical protein